MKAVISLVLGLVVLSSLTEAFLFGTKAPVDGCNPNPCKNKAQCVKDPLNPKKGSCKCLTGFYGEHCDKKDGCYSKPCKHGACVVDTLNPAKFKCKCPPGQVGEKCEKADECGKNPCQNGGTCKLDLKLKAVCTCANGWGSKHCEKRNCTIVEFKGKHFNKLPKIYIDQSVEKQFKEFDEVAKKCKVMIQQSRSFSVQPSLLLLPNDAPHYIGRGITFELQDEKGKLLCNSICLARNPIPQTAAKCFIDGATAKGWKFNPTAQQLHDNTYAANPMGYKALKESAQVGCKDKNF